MQTAHNLARMETGAARTKTGKAPNRGQFTSGDPRVKAGPGRPKLTPAEIERRRLARIANDRTVADVMAELRQMVGPAIDRLRQLIDSPDDSVALRACADLISRVNGLPVATNIIHATTGGETRRLSRDEIAQAAKTYLLQQGAALAQDVEALGLHEAGLHVVHEAAPDREPVEQGP